MSKRFALSVVLLCALLAGCAEGDSMRNVTEVVYTSDSGALLPERQWHERIVITRAKATLTRNGKMAATLINAGTWELTVDERAVAALFEQLAAVDCAKIKRVEAADAPDGGGAESYAVAYARGKTCLLLCDPGTTYTGGAAIVAPVSAFIQGLALPAAAASRYR